MLAMQAEMGHIEQSQQPIVTIHGRCTGSR